MKSRVVELVETIGSDRLNMLRLRIAKDEFYDFMMRECGDPDIVKARATLDAWIAEVERTRPPIYTVAGIAFFDATASRLYVGTLNGSRDNGLCFAALGF